MTVSAHEIWIRGLERSMPLSDEEKAMIREVPIKLRTLEAHSDIVRDGDCPSQSCLLLEGLCWRYKTTASGSRQILSLHVPGEMPDLQSLHLKVMDHNLATITRADIALIPHENLRKLSRRSPYVADALWRSTLIDAAIFREWLVGLGVRTAYQRIAHLFCEMSVRFELIGGSPLLYPLPLSQAEFGDALGLSAVHVNRSLRGLRNAGLAIMERGMVQILDLAGLRRTAEFDPDYLHLEYVGRA